MTAPAEPRAAVIEGSLREVALADVLQLLELGRKTGILHVTDAVAGRRAHLTLVQGRIRDAVIDGELAARGDRQVREVAIELLGWSSGRFAVEPLDETTATRGSTVGVDSVLMEAARRADEWARLADRVPGAHAAPRLAPVAPHAAPVVLAPEEWEVLAYADGVADLRAIAARSGRDLLAVAAAVHRLVGEGLLTVTRDAGDASEI
ncbi:protein of unknown function DUF4388 [Gemmatirosa kalamazoonensis]|uniref:PatA-like N-terminal domain-containing protein n=1 Tax=Gemmatirosa kalamazoonensis TaxID=861299 RepID=W0RJS6_9BACT|nr:DUF4388 domain-containing protein [Gemmatirosa kalamazoonensis]AHG90595.1 protein of unknown function DUF4388 [Gemmatirosa kalamazoonensis]